MLREVWPFVDDCRRTGLPVVLARLIGRDGPGARPLGATMAVAGDGTWRGSLSGGCVEGIVLDAARDVLAGAPSAVIPVSPGGYLLPWEETPSCAGELRVLIAAAPADPVHSRITTALAEDRRLFVRVALRPPYPWSVSAELHQLPQSGAAFTEILAGRSKLLLIGATDLAAIIATLAGSLGRDVVVLDPRPGHVASGDPFGGATVVRAWADEWITRHPLGPRDAVVALSHDPRIDDRALRAALSGPAGYVAALGSRATHTQRLRRLAEVPGVHRISGPAGLDLGGGDLADTALAILAELVAVENGRGGQRLREGELPIRVVGPVAGAHG
ncbi:XdhC family protein [Embleya sp. NPDC020630]|uniref:XdhC family protein n=1 Tax=Embleya sp. NPDC020630 TaxID=3363979 RepID=UPI0037A43BB4